MEPGDGPAQGLGKICIDGVGLKGQHRLIIEPAHLEGVVLDLTCAVDVVALCALGDGVNRSINVRRSGAVGVQLAPQGPAPAFQRRIVEKAEMHGLLHFERALALQIDPGAGRFDDLVRLGGQEVIERTGVVRHG